MNGAGGLIWRRLLRQVLYALWYAEAFKLLFDSQCLRFELMLGQRKL